MAERIEPRPLVLDGIFFPSVSAAAEHYGVDRKTIRRWRDTGVVPEKYRCKN